MRLGERYSAFDRLQQRRRWLGFPLAVLQKYADDQGRYLAATISFYMFFAIFPLLLVLTTVLGFLLQGNQHLERSIVGSALGQFPMIGPQLSGGSLHGSALGLGLAAADPDNLATAARHQLHDQQQAEQAEADRRGEISQRQAALRQLAEAGDWPAVRAESKRLAELDPAAADPDNLATAAREQQPAPAAVQPDCDQHPRPAGPAVRGRRARARDVPDGAARQSPDGLDQSTVLRRRGVLRAARGPGCHAGRRPARAVHRGVARGAGRHGPMTAVTKVRQCRRW